MGNGYVVPAQDSLDQLRQILQDARARLRELEAPSGDQLFEVYANETFGAPYLISVTTSSPVVGVEALIGTPLTVARGGRYLITCTATVQTRLRGTGGTVVVSVGVKDQNSAASGLGFSAPFRFGHTANDDVQLYIPVVATGIVGLADDASLVCRVVYSITPGSVDGQLEIPSVRLAVQGLKPGPG